MSHSCKTTTHSLRGLRAHDIELMDREREEIHALLTQTHTQNMEQDNHSPPANVHNMASGTL